MCGKASNRLTLLCLGLCVAALVWSCNVLRRPVPQPIAHPISQEEMAAFDDTLDDDFADYYDTLSLMEEMRILDSCEQVFLKERDSLYRMDTLFSVKNYEKTRSLNDTSFQSQALADSIIDYAKRFMRIPYHVGGNGPDKFDCSGFTSFVFRHFGIKLSRTVNGQLDNGWMMILDPKQLRRGDLVFFGSRRAVNRLGHVAIVVDNHPEKHQFTFIHATVKLGVTISTSTEKYYRLRYLTACRILP